MQCQDTSVRTDESGLVPHCQGLTEGLQQPSFTPESKSEQGKNHGQMFPIKTTALEQKFSLTKAGVTGELRAAPCREGAASHGSHTKERLFSLTSALWKTAWKSSLIHLRGSAQSQARHTQCSATALHHRPLQQLFIEAISEQQLKFVAVVRDELGGWRGIVGLRSTVKLHLFTKMLPGSQPALCRSTGRSQQLSKPPTSCQGESKVGERGGENEQDQFCNKPLFKTHSCKVSTETLNFVNSVM